MQIKEAPVPALSNGNILVKNHYSLISAGTEGSTVKIARKGFIGKAKERPQQVKQVIDTLKTQGIAQTYRAVMKKLEAYSPLGYSCVGEVVDLGSDISGIKIGDRVACGGLTACHAEVVNVPANLCVKLQPDADMKQAAYNTLGAIAMQGVRQVDLRLGETCAVIGLGLLGQLAALLLKASGIRVVGIDIDQAMVETGKKHCLALALNRSDTGIEDRIFNFSNGIGCDGVIIAASSGSLDPVNFSGAIARKKGTIVVLGAVPTGFDREPHFYKKELQIKMSCSYGPGRYDPLYEEKGLDYPAAYVRWTENRNMRAFQDLIYDNKIDVNYLTTHTFKLEDAPLAYDMMMEKAEPFIGILIEYNPQTTRIAREKVEIRSFPAGAPSAVSIGFIGAGSYAQSHLLPNITTNDNVCLKGVMTATSTGSISAAERFGFEFCAGNENDILDNKDINTVFIATRHDSHAEYVMKALMAGKHVFVEKPLCLTVEELEEISSLYNSKLKTRNSHLSLMVGYNRRYAPLAEIIKNRFGTGPMAMTYRINAGKMPSDSWIQDMETGGGRIIGEVCHFVDFLTFINGSLPVSVYAAALRAPENLNDILNISLSYKNGSIGTISYFANGDKSLPKERVEVFSNGCAAILDDFKVLAIHAKGKKRVKKMMSQDKGQKKEVQVFIKSILDATDNIIGFDEIYSASLVTFKILESIRAGLSINLHHRQ
jgi:predicted dehydrogenase/threonine dehydrogenase-like Zn-dependent dehydrogenase